MHPVRVALGVPCVLLAVLTAACGDDTDPASGASAGSGNAASGGSGNAASGGSSHTGPWGSGGETSAEDFDNIYEVGPDQDYEDPSQVPWESLGESTLVRIHYRPEPYAHK